MGFLWILVYSLVSIIVLLLLYIVYMSKGYGQLRKLGLKTAKSWPGVGNIPDVFKEGLFEYHKKRYTEFAGEKAFSVYEPGQPVIFVRDLDLIREICVKHFNTFCNRRLVTADEPLASSLFLLRDDHWKNVRNIVTPVFTAGKLKKMSGSIENNAQQLHTHLRKMCEEGREVELRDVSSNFTMDVIAGAGFGLDVNSFENKDHQFSRQANELLGGMNKAFALVTLFPFIVTLLNKFNKGVFPDGPMQFFISMIDYIVEMKKKGNKETTQTNDFIQLLCNAEEEVAAAPEDGECRSEDIGDKKKGLTRLDIQGQGVIFFIAGYDSVTTILSFTLHLLTHHPECLEKVQLEVDECLEQFVPSYENVQKLAYLDMCVQETLRMYPPTFAIERECQENITIDGVTFPKGMRVFFTVAGIHYDPKYWPEPEKFNPERFTPEEKAKRHPYAHMPFGQGPRICVGMRFALLEIKVAIATILQELTPVTCSKSVYPVTVGKILLHAKEGLWVKFNRRSKQGMAS